MRQISRHLWFSSITLLLALTIVHTQSCKRIDAITVTKNQTILVFHNDKYIHIPQEGSIDGEVYNISDWEGLVGSVDAILSIKPSIYHRVKPGGGIDIFEPVPLQHFFFQRDSVYSYEEDSKTLSPGFPKKIRDVFPGIPNYIDAVFTLSYDADRSYFVKGS